MKKVLRSRFRELRRKIAAKELKDSAICKGLSRLPEYCKAELLLLYYPLADEINIIPLISEAISSGKRTALPYCADLNGNMEFYEITALDILKSGSYGILEPDITKCRKITSFQNAVCIVPGLSFDKNGYRLGYGKGYYDRFLAAHPLFSVGLCYNELISDKLPINEFDKNVCIIITENDTYRF